MSTPPDFVPLNFGISPEFWTRPISPEMRSGLEPEVVYNKATHNIERWNGSEWVTLSHEEIDRLGPPYPDIPTR